MHLLPLLSLTVFFRAMVQSDITKLSSIQKQSLANTLELCETVAITVDLWSDRRMRSYLGVTVHFIEQGSSLSTALLSCEHFEGILDETFDVSVLQ